LADPWLGEIKLLPFDFVPRSYAACDGALMSIAQNTALFSLLGTTYGGDGRTTFALPDLRGRLPMHRAQHALGERAGAGEVSGSLAEPPEHTHQVVASAAASSGANTSVATRPTNRLLASATSATYTSGAVNTTLDPASAVAHPNMQPYSALNFVIALAGAFPSRG
jgi:microcystin-dependent protein